MFNPSRRFRHAADWHQAIPLAIALGILAGPARADVDDGEQPIKLAPEFTGFVVSASLLHDDNVTRTDSNALSDESIALGASGAYLVPITPYLRAVLSVQGGVEQFSHWVGLSHLDLGVGAALQYRPSAAFYAPTAELSLHSTASDYRVDLRTGTHSVAQLSVSQPVTDRVTAFVALNHFENRAESSTFDGHGDGIRGHLDYALAPQWTLFGSVEHRYGDAVSTSFPDPDGLAISLAHSPDPAFGDTGRITYRFKAAAQIFAIGLNRALSEHQSIEFSWQKANVEPVRLPYPSATQAKYVDNQVSLTYLVQF